MSNGVFQSVGATGSGRKGISASGAAAMDTGSRITLALGVVTAGVALTGYWLNLHIKRRELKIQTYAAALQAIHDYEELPYAIRRRQSSEAEVRAALAEKISEVISRLNYHQTFLNIDSPVVAEAYSALFARTRQFGGHYRSAAWRTRPISADEDVPRAAYYPYDSEPELKICLLAMRRELTPLGYLLRGDTRRRLKALRGQRPTWEEPEWMRDRREQLFRGQETGDPAAESTC
jgi:hypothetical protein